MSISSFNTKKASPHSSSHISRKDNFSYRLDYNYNCEYKKYIENKDEYLKLAVEATKLVTGRKMQDKAREHFWQEAVVNTCEHHNIEDIDNLFKVLNQEFKGGFVVAEIAVHKDEGVFIKSDIKIDKLKHDPSKMKWFDENCNDVSIEVISVAPGRDIFYNTEDEKWYEEDTCINEYKIHTLQKHYNYHVHIIYTKFNMELGKNIRITKRELSKIQDITASQLGMKRGKKYSRTKRMEHKQLKKMYDEVNKLKKQILMIRANSITSKIINNNYMKAMEELYEDYKVYYKNENMDESEFLDLLPLITHQLEARTLRIEQLTEELLKIKSVISSEHYDGETTSINDNVEYTVEESTHKEYKNEEQRTNKYTSFKL